MIQLALFEPEIPQNVGTILRLASCWDIKVHIIEPCGFPWNSKHLKRAGMDYLAKVSTLHHDNWEAFYERTKKESKRLVFLDVNGNNTHIDFSFDPQDILIAGREGDGFSGLTYPILKNSVRIPITSHCRSLNVAIATSIVSSEALRQTQKFPK